MTQFSHKNNRLMIATLAALGLWLITGPAQALTLEWAARNGSTAYTDESVALAVDGAENVYVTGYSGFAASGDDYCTIKYNSIGTVQWIAYYNGTGNSTDRANAIAIDAFGNVYVTGRSMNAAGNYDYATVKYNAGGVQLWVKSYNGPGGGDDEASAIVLDGTANVYITGWSVGAGTGFDYATIKYSSASVQLWVQRYDAIGSADYATCIAFDPIFGPVVGGRSYGGAGVANDYAIVKYTAAGGLSWVTRYNYAAANGNDEATAIAIDGAGTTYITGRSWGGAATNYDYATIKLAPGGGFAWTQRINGLGSGADAAHDLVLDNAGYVIVTGEATGPAANIDFLTVKFSSVGAFQWASPYARAAGGIDAAYSLAMDAANNVYVAGTGFDAVTNNDYVVVKYDAAGVYQWEAVYNYAGFGEDALDVAVDGDLNVYLTGRSNSTAINTDSQTLKYNQGATTSLTISLLPITWPILISDGAGGTFDYNVTHTNNTAMPLMYDYWLMALVTNTGSWVGPLAPTPVVLNLPPMASITRVRTQAVGIPVPLGTYVYEGRGGTFPGTVIDRSNFTFEVVAPFGGSPAGFASDWQLDDSSFPVEKVSPAKQPSEFGLSPARPNPFNPATTLSFALPASGQVSLKVFDVAGQLVATLVNGWRDAGTHEVSFDASALPSGIYLAKLQAGSSQAVQKLVLAK